MQATTVRDIYPEMARMIGVCVCVCTGTDSARVPGGFAGQPLFLPALRQVLRAHHSTRRLRRLPYLPILRLKRRSGGRNHLMGQGDSSEGKSACSQT